MKKRAAQVGSTTTEAISYSTCTTALSLEAAAIITATKSGSTARMVSKYRPHAPIVATTPTEGVYKKLLLVWGVYPLLASESQTTDTLFEKSVSTALAAGYIKNGDLVVITAGVPVGIPGSTNLIKVHTVGEVLAQGTGIGRQSVSGRVRLVLTPEDAFAKKVTKEDIIVTTSLESEYVPALAEAGALITEEGGLTSPGAIVGINLGIPVIVGVSGITQWEDGQIITVDPVRGLIYRGYAKVL